jgi:hypothetical protein
MALVGRFAKAEYYPKKNWLIPPRRRIDLLPPAQLRRYPLRGEASLLT